MHLQGGPSHMTRKPSGIHPPSTHARQNEVMYDGRSIKYYYTCPIGSVISTSHTISPKQTFPFVMYIPHSQSKEYVSVLMYIPHSQSREYISVLMYIPHSQSRENISVRMYIPHSQSRENVFVCIYMHPTQFYV